jgi:hypothetical protein
MMYLSQLGNIYLIFGLGEDLVVGCGRSRQRGSGNTVNYRQVLPMLAWLLVIASTNQ